MTRFPAPAACAFLFAALLSQAPVRAEAAPAKPFPHEQSDLAPDPGVQWHRFDNGLRVAILPHKEPPGRLSLRLHVAAGSLHEAEDQRGLAHFLEHMAFNGTRRFKPDELVELLQTAGIAFGADLNAYTSFDETVYMLDLPENSPALVDKCLTVLRDWADGMTLEEDQIEKERGVILSEKRDRDSVEMRLMEQQFLAILPEALVSRRLPIGTEVVIRSAQRDRFVDYYTRYYTPDRMTLVVAGDVDPAEILPRLKEHFATMPGPGRSAADPDLGKVRPTGMAFQAFHDSEVKSVEVGITRVAPWAPRPDTAAERARRLPLDLANAMLNRRLEVLSKKVGAPIQKGEASGSDFLDFAEFASIEATAVEERWQDALACIEQELRRALEHGFTSGEYDEAVAKLVRAYEESVKTRPTRKSAELAMDLTQAIGNGDVFTAPEAELAWLRATLPGLSPEACAAALRAAWQGDDRFVSVTLKQPLAEAARSIESVWRASAQTPVAAPTAAERQEFAYSRVGETGAVASRRVLEDLGITQMVLANNVRVNFKATPYEKNTIHILGRFGGGKLELPAGKSGLDVVASSIFHPGGLEAHSVDDLERIFAGKKVGVGFSVDDDAFTLSGATTREDLADQLRLFCAYLLHPGYRDEAERQFRNTLPMMAAQLAGTPEGVYAARGERLIMGGDERFGIDDAMKLGRFTTGDVRAWLEPALRDAALEVSIAGDFEPAELERLLLETIGALPARQANRPSFEAARVVPPMQPGTRTLEYESKVPKALNVLFWPTTDRSNIRRTRRLGVLGEVLGDRLRVKIREELGEAYSPGAAAQSSDVWKDHGYILCHSPGAPEQSAGVVRSILEIARGLADGGATPDEVTRALNPILSAVEQQRRSNSYWLQTVLARSQEKPEVLDWARTMEQDLKSITPEEISALAKSYLPPERAMVLVITTPQGGAKADGQGPKIGPGDRPADAP